MFVQAKCSSTKERFKLKVFDICCCSVLPVLVSRVSPQASENNFVRRVPIHNDSRYLVLAGKGNQKCYESPLRKCYERSPSHQT